MKDDTKTVQTSVAGIEVTSVQDRIDVLPKEVFELFPFDPEALSSWSFETDLHIFARGLFDHEGTQVLESGQVVIVNYADYGTIRYDVAVDEFSELAQRFRTQAEGRSPMPAAKGREEPTPEFLDDPHFGLAMKYNLAWDLTMSAILSEGAHFSLPHMLEAETDLSCSVLLAERMYYKQAMQVLRSFLETSVLQLYLCLHRDEFQSWREGDFHSPSVRGRSGMLKQIRELGKIDEVLSRRASNLYGVDS